MHCGFILLHLPFMTPTLATAFRCLGTLTLPHRSCVSQLTRAMNVLTEHKTTGLAGENQLAGLRSTLAETREVLRAEAYGTSAPASATSAAPPAVRQAPASLPVLGEDDKQAKVGRVIFVGAFLHSFEWKRCEEGFFRLNGELTGALPVTFQA